MGDDADWKNFLPHKLHESLRYHRRGANDPDDPYALNGLARIRGWDVFCPDWQHLAQFPVLPLASICALSVGLHPGFASPEWVAFAAIPHFDGTDTDELCPLEDDAAHVGSWRVTQLQAFLKRVTVAAANLEPLGTLAVAEGVPCGGETRVRVADFVAWAESKMSWDLPPEFPRSAVADKPGTAPEESARQITDDRDTTNGCREQRGTGGTLKIGANSKAAIGAFIHKRAVELFAEVPATTASSLAKIIADEMRISGYRGERNDFLSCATVRRVMPKGLTGGRGRPRVRAKK